MTTFEIVFTKSQKFADKAPYCSFTVQWVRHLQILNKNGTATDVDIDNLKEKLVSSG